MQDDEHDRSGEPNDGSGSGLERGNANRKADEMSDEEWLDALLELNPWAQKFDPNRWGSDEFLAAKGRAISRRLHDPASDWNQWASRIAELRSHQRKFSAIQRQAYADLISIELHHLPPRRRIDFSDRMVPHAISALGEIHYELRFDRSHIHGDLAFHCVFGELVSFENCHFYRNATFTDATFKLPANFTNTTFKSIAVFRDFDFEGDSLFTNSRFKQAAYFSHGAFAGSAIFDSARFSAGAAFSGLTFGGACSFVEARFRNGVWFMPWRDPLSKSIRPTRFARDADFTRCSFEGPAVFKDTTFARTASFRSIGSEVAFSLEGARFARIPDFRDATFHEPPRLDDCDISVEIGYPEYSSELDQRRPDRLFGIYKEIGIARDKDEHARLRKLRKTADAKDHENELKLNGYEIAARRFWEDKPNEARFWLGWLYGLTSDYGQSFFRPLFLWVATIVAFWMVFLVFTPDHTKLAHASKCHEDYRRAVGEDAAGLALTSPVWQALSLSLRNASIIAQPDASVTRRIYGCLYGFEDPTPLVAKADPSQKAHLMHPVIPTSVSYLSAIQSILSAIFLFLLGLGLRNMFRMK